MGRGPAGTRDPGRDGNVRRALSGSSSSGSSAFLGWRVERLSVARLFDRDLRWVTVHTSVLMATFIFSYHSITFWYPTFLRGLSLAPLSYLIALNAGGLIGSIVLGQLSETRLGRRGAPTLGMIVGVLAAPLFLWSSNPNLLLLGALLIGLGCSGAWGIVPGYLSERFPTEARAVGTGFAYHVGAGPRVVYAVPDRFASGPWHVAWRRDDHVHRERRRAGADHVVARSGDEGQTLD